MSCILRISGKDLDIESFIQQSKLIPFKKKYKGQSKIDSKPEGEKLDYSYVAIEVSNANFSNFPQQIADCINFLIVNKQNLLFIHSTKEVEYSILDFGVDLEIDWEIRHHQSEKFPAELLKLSGELGIDIELSIYG